MTDRLIPPPRPVGAFFRHYVLPVAGGAAGLLVMATSFLAFGVKPELQARALADAPVVEARVLGVYMEGLARFGSIPRITYVLPSGAEVTERVFAGGGISAEDLRRLSPGDRIPVHVDPAGSVASELHVRSAHWWSWVLLIVPAILLLAVALLVWPLLEMTAALVRIRRWPAALAEVRVSGRDRRALRVEARYHLGGAVRAEMPVSTEEWGRWTGLAQVPPDRDTATLPVLIDPRQPDQWRPCRLEWPWVSERSGASTSGRDVPSSSRAQASSESMVMPGPALYAARYAPSLQVGGAELTVEAVSERHVVVRGPGWSFSLDVTEGEPFLSVLETGLAVLDPEHLLVMASYEHARAAGALGYRYACLSPAGTLRWTLVSGYEAFGDVVLLPGRLLRLSAGVSPDAPLEVHVFDLDTGTVVGRHPVTIPEHMRPACREIGARSRGRFDLREGRIFVQVSLHPNTLALPSWEARGRADRGIVTIPDGGKFVEEVLLGEGDRIELRAAPHLGPSEAASDFEGAARVDHSPRSGSERDTSGQAATWDRGNRVTEMFEQGVLMAERGQLEDALDAFTSIPSDAPEFGAAVFNRAVLLARLGFLSDAITSLERLNESGDPEITRILTECKTKALGSTACIDTPLRRA